MGALKGWRTVLVNGITAGIAWANVKFNWLDLSGDEQAAFAVTALAIVNLGLRAITNSGIFKK